jgi:hypothetical protein
MNIAQEGLLTALAWGLLGASALPLGAAAGCWLRLKPWLAKSLSR